MVKQILALTLTIVTAVAAVPPVRTMYNDALERERIVRAAMSADDVPGGVLERARSVIARYELLVKHYPASGYSDNALWQAGQLALDIFATFGQPRDRDAGVRQLLQIAARLLERDLVTLRRGAVPHRLLPRRLLQLV